MRPNFERSLCQYGELPSGRTIGKFRIVAREAARDMERLVDHYNLEAILQVGYRVPAKNKGRDA